MTDKTITEALHEQLSTEVAEAQARYWQFVERAVDNRQLDAKAIAAVRADLQLLDLDTAALQRDVNLIRWLRNPDLDRPVEAAQEQVARCRERQRAAEEAMSEHRARLEEAERTLAVANLAATAAGDQAVRADGQRRQGMLRATEAEAELRDRGYTGDLGTRPAAPGIVRVRATGQCFVEHVMRDVGEVFEVSTDQLGDLLEPVPPNTPLGKVKAVYRVRALRRFEDALRFKRAPGDVFELEHLPSGELVEVVGDDVPLGPAELESDEDFDRIDDIRPSSRPANPIDPADLADHSDEVQP